MFVPHFLKEFKAVAAVGEEGDPDLHPAPCRGSASTHPDPVIIQMTPSKTRMC